MSDEKVTVQYLDDGRYAVTSYRPHKPEGLRLRLYGYYPTEAMANYRAAQVRRSRRVAP